MKWSKKKKKKKLTSTHAIIFQLATIRRRRISPPITLGRITPDDTTTTMLSTWRPLSHHLHLTSTTGPRTGSLVGRSTQQLADLKEVQFKRVHETCSLAVLRRGADRDRVVFDNVADTEAVARGRAEPEMTQTGVSAVRRGQDRVVDAVPAGVVEDGRRGGHGTHTAQAVAVVAAAAVFGDHGL